VHSDIESLDSQRALQSDADPPEEHVEDSLVQSGTLSKNLGEEPIEPVKTSQQDSRQLATRLGISFAVLIIILLATAYLTLDRMRRTNASARDTLSESLLELQLAQDGLRYSSENSRVTMEIFMVQRPEVIDELLGRRAENSRKIETLIQALQTRSESDEEERLLETVKQTREIYVTGGPFTCCWMKRSGMLRTS
jgi:hypothetical protein